MKTVEKGGMEDMNSRNVGTWWGHLDFTSWSMRLTLVELTTLWEDAALGMGLWEGVLSSELLS